MKKRIIVIFVLCLICSLFPFTSLHAFGSLKNTIQKELDSNPFLKNTGIKLRVIDDKNGYITIGMYNGNRKVREKIDKGFDLFTIKIEQNSFLSNSGKNKKQSLTILQQTIAFLKTIKGVKGVMLVAAVNTPKDQAEDYLKKGRFFASKKQYTETIKWYRKAAEQGSSAA